MKPLLSLLLLLGVSGSSLGRGPYWDLTSSVRGAYDRYERWDALEPATWAPDHAKLEDRGSYNMTFNDYCSCIEACRLQIACLSVSVRASSDTSVDCVLSDTRGQADRLTDSSGYVHYQRSGVAKLSDSCTSEDECASSDIFSECSEEGICKCIENSYLEGGVCKVSCPSGWHKMELSDRTNCYFISRERVPSSQLVDRCAQNGVKGSIIADVKNAEEQSAIRSVLSRHFTWSDRIMFGLNDFGGYYNYYGRVPEGSDEPPPKAEFFSWGGREPNNAQEHCHVFFKGYDWSWADVDCQTFNYYYVCEVEVVP